MSGLGEYAVNDLAGLPLLHPTRLARVLVVVEDQLANGSLTAEQVIHAQTAAAAMSQILRTQKAIGFTAEVADGARELIQATGSFSKLFRRRK